MAQRTTIPLLGPDYSERSTNVNAQRTVNLWPRMQKPGAKTQIALYTPPGLDYLCIAGTGPNRGNGVVFGAHAYFVSGSGFFQIDSAGTPLDKGTLNTSAGRIEMAVGRDYLMIVDGTDGYTWNGTTFAVISDGDFPTDPSHVTYIDGYFVVNKGDSDEYYISAPEDPTAWNALDFESAVAKPDDCLALTASHKDLYILGSASVQIYYNSGNRDFPFTYYTGGMIDTGIVAPHSLSEGSQGLFFLSVAEEGGIGVVQIRGFQPAIISDDIASDLSSLTTVNDAEGLFYRSGERSFYQLTFPTEGKTFEYVVEDNFWVERKTYGLDRYRVNGHVYFNNQNLFGDYSSNGKYYKTNLESYTDDGAVIERIRVTQPIHRDGRRITFSQLVLEIESGIGLVLGQGSDPFIMMRYSDDGGHTWSSELTASMGKIGEYNVILQWDKLGQSRSRIFEFKVTDPVKVVFVNGYIKAVVHDD